MLPMQIDVESASRLLTEDESVLLLDVRELAEYETVPLPNSLLIPTSEFMEKVEPLKARQRGCEQTDLSRPKVSQGELMLGRSSWILA